MRIYFTSFYVKMYYRGSEKARNFFGGPLIQILMKNLEIFLQDFGPILDPNLGPKIGHNFEHQMMPFNGLYT